MKRPLLILFSCFTITFFSNCTAPSSSSYNDSTKLDTSVVDSTTKVDTTSNAPDVSKEVSEAKLLKPFDTDKATFNKLYAKARKKGDEFSSSIIITDITSPAYVNRNGIFCGINKAKDYIELYFAIQYFADDWLFIENMIFNLDGENFTYAPGDFKRDNGDGMIWEWNNHRVDDLPLIIKIATAKNAKVKFNGQQYYKVVHITPTQQKALRNILSIYNGLLKGYKK